MVLFSLLLLISLGFIDKIQTQTPLLKADIEGILQYTQDKKYENLQSFMDDIVIHTQNNMLSNSIKKYRQGDRLQGADWINICRLSGIFARIHYKDDTLQLLSKLMAMPTDSVPGIFQYDNPNVIRFGKAIERGETGDRAFIFCKLLTSQISISARSEGD